MSYQLTREDIHRSLIEEGIKFEDNKPSILNKAAQGAQKFNQAFEESGLPNLGAYALEAPVQIAENLLNAPKALSNKFGGPEIPGIKFPKAIFPTSHTGNLPDTSQTRAMGAIGNVAGSMLPVTTAYNAIGKLAGFGAKTPLIGRAAAGAATGYGVSGEDQFGGRELGALLGGILPPAYGVSERGLGEKAAKINKEHTEKYNKLYEKIIEEANKAGVSSNIKVPEILKNQTEEIGKLFKHGSSKYTASIKRFMQNPSVQNAHDAQSDLGKIIRAVDKKISENKSLGTGENDLPRIASDLQKRIRGAMSQGFSKSGVPELTKEYSKATKGYLEETVPFKSKEMSQYSYGKGKAADVGEELLNSKSFSKSGMSKVLPGYQARKIYHDIPPWVKLAGGVAAIPLLQSAGIPVHYLIQRLLEQK